MPTTVMKNATVKAMKSVLYAEMVAIGAAGTGSRARTQRSKREKQNDPRLQRKHRRDWSE